jgi:hypothetical protein
MSQFNVYRNWWMVIAVVVLGSGFYLWRISRKMAKSG